MYFTEGKTKTEKEKQKYINAASNATIGRASQGSTEHTEVSQQAMDKSSTLTGKI